MTAALPTDIPTLQEILASKDILFQSKAFPQKVVRVRNYAIKIHTAGPSFEREPDNLRFLSQFPGLNVPNCYAAFEDSSIWPFDSQYCTSEQYGPKVYYMIIDFIPGDTIEHRWDSLSAEQHKVVLKKLREQVKILSSIRSPEPYFGESGSRPYENGTFSAFMPKCGPYTNDEDLINDVIKSFDMTKVPEKERFRVNFALKVIRESSLFRGFSSAIRVADFQAKNVMVTVRGKAEDGGKYDLEGDDDIVVSLIDWETLTWVPEWYQYCDQVYLPEGEPEWWDEVMIETIEPWYAQFGWWRIIDPYLRQWC